MKRFNCLILLFSAISAFLNPAHAQHRSVEAAAALAEAQIEDLVYQNEAVLVFNNRVAEGYKIISADEVLPEVLGYSDQGIFDPNDIPENMQYWMSLIAKAEEMIKAGQITKEEVFAKSAVAKQVSPLLKDISWGQRAPFNSKCPVINDSTCLAGCVATALGMLTKYYEHPKQPIGYTSYISTTRKLSLSMDFSQVKFDWDKIQPKYGLKQNDVSGETAVTTGAQLKFGDLTLKENRGYLYCNITNLRLTGGSFEGFIEVLVYDTSDKFIKSASTNKAITLNSGYKYSNYSISIALPSDIADGSYRIYLGCKTKSETSWHRMSTDGTMSTSYVTATKSGSSFTLFGETGVCSYSAEEEAAVGNLIYAIGILANMNYNTKSSGAVTANAVTEMTKKFGYDPDAWSAHQEHFTTGSYEKAICERIDAKHPILVSGHSGSSGHAFILDGYRAEEDAETYYHINWGWTGTSDGYFLITYLAPKEAGDGGAVTNYSDDLTLFMDLYPDDGQNTRGPEISYESVTPATTELNAGESTSVTITNLYNVGTQLISGYVYAFIVNEKGEETNVGRVVYTTSWPSGNYFRSLSDRTISIPNNTPSGKYHLILRAIQMDGSSTYGDYHTKSDPILTITNPTGISEITREMDEEEVVYDLLGRPTKRNLTNKNHIYINKNHQKMIIH